MITGWEWILIIGVFLAFLLYGPNKIPELARSLGLAKGEFEKAKDEFEKVSKEYTKGTPEEITKTSSINDEQFIQLAKGLDITTEGKNKEELYQEMISKLPLKKDNS